MNIKMDELIKAIAASLDIVEIELLGATSNHGKRIAVLTASMGRYFNFDKDYLIALTTCALFHDNALTEYILSERENRETEFNTKQHCIIGQCNVETIPFKVDISGFILYHHERSDGSGAFGKKEGEFPLAAELIAIADMLDVQYALQNIQVEDLPVVRKDIEEKIGYVYTKRSAEAMLDILTSKMLLSLHDSVICNTAKSLIPSWSVSTEDITVIRLAEFVASIIDYKSTFTKKHSTEIANKIWFMCNYYKFDCATRIKAYLAASLHDIGKLKTPTSILEKPGKLTDSEFVIIKDHAMQTYEILKDLEGLDKICMWASNHHEKLDGTGYPFGKKADNLDFISRLMACIDIYQAVSEERPYHPARSHEDAMLILHDMAQKGFIDRQITNDIGIVMPAYTGVRE